MFDSLLIANRGEIACRIIRSARSLGVRTVAVYSEADRQARHVALADEAWLIGPAPASESYLQIESLMRVAGDAGVQALHPGYGFLAESADLARACEQAGLVFVGPPVAAIEAMGSKSAAKAIMEKAEVPLVPGYHGQEQDHDTLRAAAERIGFPLLVKASSGGGGKGMRVVEKPEELVSALEGARREAASAFGDDRLLLERYVQRPRHVEVQVFADTQGNYVHLFERDCSVQRRHQKVLEEAPAPRMAPQLRETMGAVALAAAKAIDYVGAGTVEFLLDTDDSFYFMEMNTRLQVEHPVTEMITGQDLVAWQLKVAAGEPLPCGQQDLVINGHAIEARLYAEDPRRDFLPSIGSLRHLRFPAEDCHLRIDTGVCQGDEVSIHYDPMIAKLIVWGEDRNAALRRLHRALGAVEVVGVTTNLAFLAAVVRHEKFASGQFTTDFIDLHRKQLVPEPGSVPEQILNLAALDQLLRSEAGASSRAAQTCDPWAPWNLVSGWRLNGENQQRFVFLDGDDEREVLVHFRRGGFLIESAGGCHEVSGSLTCEGILQADLDGRQMEARVIARGRELTIFCHGASHHLLISDPSEEAAGPDEAGGSLNAPMPGQVVAVLVSAETRVARGEPLVVLEAMKMEHTITAPAGGLVKRLNYQPGAMVHEGAPLLEFEADEGS